MKNDKKLIDEINQERHDGAVLMGLMVIVFSFCVGLLIGFYVSGCMR